MPIGIPTRYDNIKRMTEIEKYHSEGLQGLFSKFGDHSEGLRGLFSTFGDDADTKKIIRNLASGLFRGPL